MHTLPFRALDWLFDQSLVLVLVLFVLPSFCVVQCILYLNRELDSHKARTIMGSPPGQGGGGLDLVAGTRSTYRDFNDSYGTTTGYQGTNATGGDNDIYSFEGRFEQHSNSSDSQPVGGGTGAGAASFAVDGHTSRAMGAFGDSTDIYNNGVY